MTKKIERLLPAAIEKWSDDAINTYSVLMGIDTSLHYTAKLVAIMMRLDYEPRLELLAGNPEAIPSGYNVLVAKHVSQELLDDLQATIELAETDSRVEALSMHDEAGNPVDGTIYVAEGATMSYTDHSKEKVDLSVDRGESWGSW